MSHSMPAKRPCQETEPKLYISTSFPLKNLTNDSRSPLLAFIRLHWAVLGVEFIRALCQDPLDTLGEVAAELGVNDLDELVDGNRVDALLKGCFAKRGLRSLRSATSSLLGRRGSTSLRRYQTLPQRPGTIHGAGYQ